MIRLEGLSQGLQDRLEFFENEFWRAHACNPQQEMAAAPATNASEATTATDSFL